MILGHEVTRWPRTMVFLGQGPVATMLRNNGSTLKPGPGMYAQFLAIGVLLPPDIAKPRPRAVEALEQFAQALRVSAEVLAGVGHVEDGDGIVSTVASDPVPGPFHVVIELSGLATVKAPTVDPVTGRPSADDATETRFQVEDYAWQFDGLVVRWVVTQKGVELEPTHHHHDGGHGLHPEPIITPLTP